jgi:hypothetical protein
VNYERDGIRDFTWPWGAVFAPAKEDGAAPMHPIALGFSCVGPEDTFQHWMMRSKSNASNG